MSGGLEPLPVIDNLGSLRERELLVQKLQIGLRDGKPAIENIKGIVPEAISCSKTNCRFYTHSRNGARPCNECRFLTKGDFYIPKG